MSTTNPNNSPPAATTTSEYRLNVHAAGKTYSLDFQHAWHRWVGPALRLGEPGRTAAPTGPNSTAQAGGLGDRVRVMRLQGPAGRDSRRQGVTALWALCCVASAFVPGRWPRLSSSAPSGQDSSSSVDATLSETASTDPALGAGACDSFTASPLQAIETAPRGTNSGRNNGGRLAAVLAAHTACVCYNSGSLLSGAH